MQLDLVLKIEERFDIPVPVVLWIDRLEDTLVEADGRRIDL